MDDYGVSDAALEQRIAELSDEQFDKLVARTRPPRVDPADRRSSMASKAEQLRRLMNGQEGTT